MAHELIGDYEIEYSGQRVIGAEGWVANVAIFGHSTNPMHRNAIFPAQRVLVDQTFDDEQAAQQAALKVAHEMLQAHAHAPAGH
ncbi:hypothetical protein [Herbaspirillum sp. YR522]|uniref:hypothetical protein n=1 Tax=Herbaspirillum sp. YR522 TaxID=1144342 RepID=UPI00026F883E|nr:hypothetical protein [Herbaspirillum sp. YR522]EJN06933.1 hypothetical protein PMI40_02118 [Herbaspirillum sp. YR522]